MIGRHDLCHLRPNAITVSPKHLMLTLDLDSPGLVVNNISTNGNWLLVNGLSQGKLAVVKEGDNFQAGSMMFEVVSIPVF